MDPKISVISVKRRLINKGKITNYLSTINCGRVDKNPYCFLLVNKLTGWWLESHFDIIVFLLFFFFIYVLLCVFCISLV